MLIIRKILSVLAIFIYTYTVAQDVPISFRNEAIYDFLDELANGRIIEINSSVKPFTNSFILKCLNDAEKRREVLSSRQQKELDFYLRQYGFIGIKGNNSYAESRKGNLITKKPGFNLGFLPMGLHYKDSLFTFSLRPIWGIREYTSGGNRIMHTWGGAERGEALARFLSMQV